MFLIAKPSGSTCQYTVVLVLLCLLLLPLQLLALTCHKCGFNYNRKDFSFCPMCGEEAENEDLLHRTMPSQSAAPVSPGAQVDESLRNLEFAVNVFSRAAPNIPENFVLSPDSLFQTLALLVLNAGPDGAIEQWRQNCLSEDHSKPSGAAAHEQNKNPSSIILLAASQPEAVAVYRERLKQIHDDFRGKINLMSLTPMHGLAQELNGLFCQLTHGMVHRLCSPIAWSLSTYMELMTSIYFTGLLERSRGTENAALFTLPDGQAAVVDRIMNGEINPSRYAHHNDWEAVTFPYRRDDEIILVLPPPETMLRAVTSKIITALFSSLDSDESFSSSLTMTPGLPPSKIAKNTDLSEALRPSGSGLLSVVTTDLSSGAMPALSFPMNAFSNQEAPDAALTNTDSNRNREGDRIQSIRFDRPFLYILRNKITKRINLIGRYFFPPDSGTSSSRKTKKQKKQQIKK
ncbi:serpin family protein [Endozoicomonas sp. ALB032]|uniref:serpin family protein n=1 Tax=Endozoicomonas sp. ALB032 TaxID=3403082 RepID=UPI003BB6358F